MKKNYLTLFEKVLKVNAFSLITMLCVLVSGGASAQKSKPALGVSLTSSLTGIGFGTQYSPGLFLVSGKKRIEAGPVFQKRDMNFTGFRANFSYTVYDGATALYPGNEKLELFFYNEAIWHNSAKLGKSQMQLEKQVSRNELKVDLAALSYKAVEAYAGFGLRIKLTNQLKWGNAIGVGGWHTISGEKDLEREYNSMSLVFRTNLTWQF